MKNASVVIALIVGMVLGVVLGRMTGEPGAAGTDTMARGAAEAGAAPTGADPTPGTGTPSADAPVKVSLDGAFTKGPDDALVTIVEWSDFQCPFCNRVGPTIKQIEETYGDKVRVAFKHNPLSFHQNAHLAAQAAEAAGVQGKFWEMHDKMFANQKALLRPDLERYAQELGLDMAKFKSDLDQGVHKAKVDRHQRRAIAVGATGTPAFFINGQYLRGAQPFPKFKEVIDGELARAERMVQAGTPKNKVYESIIAKGQARIPAAKPTPQQQPQRAQFAKVNVGDAHTMGAKQPKVTIVEWSDFQCPFCSRVTPTLDQIKKEYGDSVQVAFKHQPLPFHKNAQLAAEAAEAAGAQGKFWEMHDKMFANQKALLRPDLERYAQEIGLDMGKFKAALDQGTFKKKVTAHSTEGRGVGANGTPTFFINGRLLSGARPFEQFKTVIDEEIKSADALLASGVAKDQLYAKILEQNEKKFKTAPAPQPTAAPAPPAVVDIEPGKAPIKGDPNAQVTIVAFSDFQCPFCSRVNPTIDQVMEEYKGKVKVAFKHQPLPFHQDAPLAAEASLAAHEQGKFWEMHDKMFANQKALKRPDLERYAQEIGLDMGKFQSALDSGKFKAQIKEDQQLASKVGANGTPTFFINGERFVGAQPFDRFKAVIDRQLSKGNAAKR